MNNDLIIMTFDQEEDAVKARQSLQMMRGSQILGLVNAVMITRDSSGKAALHQKWELPTNLHSPKSQLPGLFADAFFGEPTEERVQKLTDAGLDKTFLEGMAAALGPGSSALLIYIPQDSLVDTQRLLSTLGLLKGTVHHTTFPASVEEVVLGQGAAK